MWGKFKKFVLLGNFVTQFQGAMRGEGVCEDETERK